MARNKPRLDKGTLTEALYTYNGFVTLVASYFQCSTQWIYNRVKWYALEDELQSARRTAADGFGGALMRAANEGDVKAASMGWNSLKHHWDPDEEEFDGDEVIRSIAEEYKELSHGKVSKDEN